MLAANFLLLAAVLFCIGVFGVISRRNAVMVLMSIELILNSVNLNLIAFSLMLAKMSNDPPATFPAGDPGGVSTLANPLAVKRPPLLLPA